MSRSCRRVLLSFGALLGFGTGFIVWFWLAPNRPQEPQVSNPVEEPTTNPHVANAKHPEEVARIMRLLPQIPMDGTLDEIRLLLRLQRDPDGGEGSLRYFTFCWDVAPEYRFALSFDVVYSDGKFTQVFTEASFSAPNKPGFPSDQYYTVYPYRARRGMKHGPDEVIRFLPSTRLPA